MKRFLLIPVALVLFAAGCAGLTPEQVADLKADRQALVDKLPGLDAEISKLPENDPLRKVYERNRASAITALRALDAAIRAAESGVIAPEDQSAFEKLPVVGPYVGLAFGLGSLLFGAYQRRQKRKADEATAKLDKALTQVVQSVETAFPNKTADEKLAMASQQDGDTQRAVSARKVFNPAAEMVLNEDEPAVPAVVTK
jgi:hypothetical protein